MAKLKQLWKQVMDSLWLVPGLLTVSAVVLQLASTQLSPRVLRSFMASASITGAVVLMLVSIGFLIFFIHSVVRAREAGYILRMDERDAAAAAAGHAPPLTVRMERKVGDFVLPGEPLYAVWPAAALDDGLADGLREIVVLGPERTPHQDVACGARRRGRWRCAGGYGLSRWPAP